jgi:anti-anti-sigma factor
VPPPFACVTTPDGVDSAWVELRGELDMATAPQLAWTLREPPLLVPHLVVLDLRELWFIDSSGVRAIAEASIRARRSGRRLVLVGGSAAVQRMFTLTGRSADVDILDLDPVEQPAEIIPRLAREDQAS